MNTDKSKLSAAVAFVLIAETAKYRADNTTDPEAKITLMRIREHAVAGLRQLESRDDGTVNCAECGRIVCVAEAMPIVSRETAGPLSRPCGYLCLGCHSGQKPTADSTVPEHSEIRSES